MVCSVKLYIIKEYYGCQELMQIILMLEKILLFAFSLDLYIIRKSLNLLVSGFRRKDKINVIL